MNTWEEYKDYVSSWETPTSPLQSDQRNLLKLFDQLIEYGVPTPESIIKRSNLREITKNLRIAITNRDWDAVEQILYDASTLNARELRIKLGNARRQKIIVSEHSRRYHFSLTRDQYLLLQRQMMASFEFVEA